MTSHIPHINLAEFVYHLPNERIAFEPLAERSASKLLVADAATGAITHSTFEHIPAFLPENSLLVVNSTRVIAARIPMHKSSGGAVEVFVLSPADATPPPVALNATSPVQWKCLLRGKNLREGTILTAEHDNVQLTATIILRSDNTTIVEFTWHTGVEFANILDHFGHIPLPPYIKRDDTPADAVRYQTVYADTSGSVAAPTAGLHFTPEVFTALTAKHIRRVSVNLTVGLGTFKPIDTDSIDNFRMHGEQIAVQRSEIQAVISWLEQESRGRFICVGTTSVRTMESLYWFGVRLICNDNSAKELPHFALGQWDAYRLSETASTISAAESLRAILEWMDIHTITELVGTTEIIIVPGYQFRFCTALITNFHQPHSTLILLVAAFAGTGFQRAIYDSALANDYRFLSYGDSSLLLGAH